MKFHEISLWFCAFWSLCSGWVCHTIPHILQVLRPGLTCLFCLKHARACFSVRAHFSTYLGLTRFFILVSFKAVNVAQQCSVTPLPKMPKFLVEELKIGPKWGFTKEQGKMISIFINLEWTLIMLESLLKFNGNHIWR